MSAENQAGKRAKPAREGVQERKYLRELTAAVRDHLADLDAEMATPNSKGRGERIARLANALSLANDRARYFGLGIDFLIDMKEARP